MSQQINLANPLLLRKRYAFGVREMAIVGGLVLVAALAWGGVLHHRAGALEAEAAAADARLAEAQRALEARLAAVRRPPSVLLAQRIEAAQAQVAQREALLASVDSLVQTPAPGFSARLRALSASHLEGVWLNAFVFAPDSLALKGSALQARLVSDYLERLGRQAPFAGLRFSSVQAAPVPARPADETGGAAPRPATIDFELVAGPAASRETPRVQ